MVFPVPRRVRMLSLRDCKRFVWNCCLVTFIMLFIDGFGFIKFYFEKDFETEFSYPLDVPGFPDVVRRFGRGEQVEYHPINEKLSTIEFDSTSSVCNKTLGLLILVKSAPTHLDKREAIRKTWGDPKYLQKVSEGISDNSRLKLCQNSQNLHFRIKLIFLLGHSTFDAPVPDNRGFPKSVISSDDENELKDISKQHFSPSFRALSVEEEMLKYKDIVRAKFVDSYENNTLKILVGLRYALEQCQNFSYAFLVDDDMYLNVANLIKFIEEPTNYPSSSIWPAQANDTTSQTLKSCRDNQEHLYAGKVLWTRPIRYVVSKWYLSLQEYPFNYFPPYMPAAAIVLSKTVVKDFLHASMFTEYFRFDDVYMGILAYKMNVTLVDSRFFYVCHTPTGQCADPDRTNFPTVYSEGDYSRHLIALHGLKNSKEMLEFWEKQKIKGNI